MNDKDKVVNELNKREWCAGNGEYTPSYTFGNESAKILFDDVKRPKHYNVGNIETIEIIKEITQHYTGFQAYLVGNVVKYLPRAPHKGKKLEDLQKAHDYLGRLIEEVEREESGLIN